MKFVKYFFTILVSLILTINVAIAEKWDMALAYGAGNFHSANAAEFAKNVSEKKVLNLKSIIIKTSIFTGLAAYWGIILVGTLITFS